MRNPRTPGGNGYWLMGNEKGGKLRKNEERGKIKEKLK
jgi:hypothetical protein